MVAIAIAAPITLHEIAVAVDALEAFLMKHVPVAVSTSHGSAHVVHWNCEERVLL